MSNNTTTISLDEGWENEIKPKAIDVLEDMLNNDFNGKKKFSNEEYIHTYTTCYNMCVQRAPYNYSEQLYKRHGETIENYLTNTVLPAINSKNNDFILTELVHRWGNHKIMNMWMRKFFMYLDRYYVNHENLPALEDSGVTKFKTIVYDVVKERVVDALLQEIDRERENAVIDRQRVRDCISLLEDIGMATLDVYTNDFEEQLLESTTRYYRNKAAAWLESESTPSYLISTEQALEEEKNRVDQYLNKSTKECLLRVVETELLKTPGQQLLEKEGSGCRALLANNRLDDLSRMFRLFGQVPDGLDPMAGLVRQHIEDEGMGIVSARKARIEESERDSAQDPIFVKALLNLHIKYTQLMQEQFGGHSLFQKAMKEAFVSVVNRDVGKYKTADLLSSYCDRILKTGGEKMSDEMVEENLSKLVQLFGYLTEKDLFAEIYRNQLSKRLLHQRSASDDWERTMITKLKIACGAQFTSKMEGMLNDLNIGGDASEAFAAHLREGQIDTALDISVQVLTTGYWPSHTAVDIALPPEMARCVNIFAEYYVETTSHRRLQWMHALGNATVKATYTGGSRTKSYDFEVTTLQAVAIKLFNTNDTMSFGEIKEALNADDVVLKRILHSLSCTKHKVLRKTPKSNSIKPTDSFAYNAAFTSPKKRITIPMASLEDSHNQAKRVEEDRTFAIEAAIVRIMKARKSLAHQALVAEVLSQLVLFRPNPRTVKRRIEALIEREYLERDPDQSGVYRYLA
uniref:Cullin family profile domain-containing protein n=1 Tax=Phaeomonas parva TaxID=124430 RepID=A0A7S1TYF3_9STRA